MSSAAIMAQLGKDQYKPVAECESDFLIHETVAVVHRYQAMNVNRDSPALIAQNKDHVIVCNKHSIFG